MESQKVNGLNFPEEPNVGSSEPAGSDSPDFATGGNRPRENFSELRLYEVMADAVRSSLDEFLQPLQSPPDSTYVVKVLVRDDFLPKFHSMANALADNCCQKLVKIIRASSRIAAVREAPTPELAKRIRDASFKPLDNILSSYAGAARRAGVINSNIHKIRDAIHRRSTGARPPEEISASPEPTNGAAPAEEWATDEELARQHERLIRAKAQAYARMTDYLNSLQQLPDAIMAYGCDKCFAGEVNFELELEQVAKIKLAFKNKLANAIETLGRVMSTTRSELEQEQVFIAASIQQEQFHHALEEMAAKKMEQKEKAERKFKRIAFIFLFSILIGLGIFGWWVAHQL
jgi:hypothetical protein